MAELKRDRVRYIRDFVKKDYIRDVRCYICGSKNNLELHHLYSLTQLFDEWVEEKHLLNINSVERIKDLQAQFREDKKEFLDNKYLLTLCSSHHRKLHSIYGQRYSNKVVPKILRWVNLQREKYEWDGKNG